MLQVAVEGEIDDEVSDSNAEHLLSLCLFLLCRLLLLVGRTVREPNQLPHVLLQLIDRPG